MIRVGVPLPDSWQPAGFMALRNLMNPIVRKKIQLRRDIRTQTDCFRETGPAYACAVAVWSVSFLTEPRRRWVRRQSSLSATIHSEYASARSLPEHSEYHFQSRFRAP